MSSVIREEILVQGKPTEVLCLGQTLSENPENIILIIPGNPGLPLYYVRFMETIYKHLKDTHSVWTVSNAAQCQTSHTSFWPSNKHLYNYEDQIDHKISFIKDHVPQGAKITLIGHSIGCDIILKILENLESISGVSVQKNYLLFPTIERMRVAPNGRVRWPFFSYLRWLVVFIGFVLYCLPQKVKDVLVRWYLGPVPDCVIEATIDLLHPKVVQNCLWMAYHELRDVCEADVETIGKHKNDIVLYYGATDKWTPLNYREDLKKKIEGVNAILCEDGFAHAFVCHHSEPMGEKVVQWITS